MADLAFALRWPKRAAGVGGAQNPAAIRWRPHAEIDECGAKPTGLHLANTAI